MRTIYFLMRMLGTAGLIYVSAPKFFTWWVTSSNIFAYVSAINAISPAVSAAFPQAEIGLLILFLLCYCTATALTNLFKTVVDALSYAFDVLLINLKQKRNISPSI